MKLAAEFRGLLSGLALVGLATLLAIEAPAILPGQELLHSLRFHIGAALLGLVIMLLITKAWWRGVLLLLIVALSLGQGTLLVLRQAEGRAAFNDQTPLASLRLLSFNVLASNERGAEIADYMAQTGADVVFTMESNAVLPQLDRIATTFPFRAGCSPDGQQCDTMLFSRTPLTDIRVRQIGPFGRWRLVVARTNIDGQDVTLAATHLSKPYFDEAASVELWQIRRALRDIEGPLVLAGDFNAAPWSETVYRFAADLDLIPPPFYPATWPVRLGALGVPIDNMFTRGTARINSIAATPDALGSNHRGLLATIGLYAPD